MIAFRIADRRHPIFDSTGAFLKGGRWNSPGKHVIYAAQTYSGAVLEVLVHSNLSLLPRTQSVIEITIPDDVPVESLKPSDLPGWAADDLVASRQFGDQWIEERRSAVLVVPSVVLQGREANILVNPHHEYFPRIRASAPEPVQWDLRLFSPRGSDVP
jgi:RES domain-containing protein